MSETNPDVEEIVGRLSDLAMDEGYRAVLNDRKADFKPLFRPLVKALLGARDAMSKINSALGVSE